MHLKFVYVIRFVRFRNLNSLNRPLQLSAIFIVGEFDLLACIPNLSRLKPSREHIRKLHLQRAVNTQPFVFLAIVNICRDLPYDGIANPR